MKSVLISIQPKWCELIASGKKTVEVRKTRPKIETPFKCYIYCTKDKHGWFDFLNKVRLDGKVIGEFVCDNIFTDKTFGHYGIFKTSACMSDADISAYCLNKEMYCWHISELVIYDKPKEVSEFSVLDDKAIKECKHRERIYVNPESVNGAWLKGSYICTKGEEDWCSKCKTKPLTRPPQSWCYVEEGV